MNIEKFFATTGTELERFFQEHAAHITLAGNTIKAVRAGSTKPRFDGTMLSIKLLSTSMVGSFCHLLMQELFVLYPDKVHDPKELAGTAVGNSFLDWLSTEIDVLLRYRIDPEPLVDLVWESFLRAWHRVHHLKDRKVYDVSPGIGELLLHTETRGLTTEDIRLPYPSIYIQLPKGLLGFDGFLTGGNVHVVDGVHGIVGNAEHLTTSSVQGVYLKEHVEESGRISWYVLACGFPDDRRVDLTGFSFALYFEPGQKIQTALDSLNNAAEGYSPAWRRFINWLLNIVLYTTSDNAELASGFANKEYAALTDRLKAAQGTKREKIKEQRKRMDPQARIYVGRSVRALDVRERLAALTAQVGASRAAVLLRKTKVPGYYKKQHFGPKVIVETDPEPRLPRCIERKRIFVEPYWKHKDATEESNPVHVLAGGGTAHATL